MLRKGGKKKVAGVLMLKGDSLLLQHRDDKEGLPYAGKWSIPSGHLEMSESAEECAKREFLEETDYRLEALKPLTVMKDKDDTETEYLLTLFWTCYDGTQRLQCYEGQELRFIKRSEAASYPMPPFITNVWDLALKEKKIYDTRHQK